MRPLIVLALLSLPACSTSPTPLSIDVTTGQETGAFADAGVTSVTVAVTSLDRTVNDVAKGVSPDGGSFDFGNIANTEQICVAATGYDAQDAGVMTGQSLSGLLLSAVSGDVPVFIQQKGQWARPTGGLESTHVKGVAAVVGENDLLITGGTATTQSTTPAASVDGYDLFTLGGEATTQAFITPPPLTMVPLLPISTSSTTITDVNILLINESATATWLDYSMLLAGTTPDSATVALPTGYSFADVAGGTLVNGVGGTVYVVGAGRSTSASSTVVEVDDDETLTPYTLSAKRKGAAATFVSHVGLIVAGGSGSATGVEVPVSDADSVGLLGKYPADATAGAGAVTDGADGFYLVGGTLNGGPAPTRHFALLPSCTSTCTPEPVPGADIPVALQNVTAYQLAATAPCATGTTATAQPTQRVLVVGEGTGGTLSYIVDLASTPATVTAVPLREPRRGATTIPVPLGALAVIGGEHLDGTPALSVELFAP